MPAKKVSTAHQSASKPTRAALRQQLARDLAAVLANPETPATLYNDIADRISDMSSDMDYHTPAMIESAITAHLAREAKRLKGAEREAGSL